MRSTVFRWQPRLALLAALLCASVSFQAYADAQIYDFRVLEQRAQPRSNFVQGLQIHGDSLYVGTGRYGESSLREYHFASMALLRETRLPETLFGEGVTRLGDHIYQLTWRARRLLIHDAETFKLIRVASIPTEGWGITHNGSQLIYSDGSDQLYFISPESQQLERSLTVTYGGRALARLNELEWVDGQIWANVWGSNQLVRIDPDSGVVNAVADLRGLLDPAERLPDTDVLNGIAWEGIDNELWVTGKRWPWLYRIRLEERPAPSAPDGNDARR